MMIEFDPRLLEETVFLALRKIAGKGSSEFDRYHLIADELYEISDLERRDAAFHKLHRDTFERLGLNDPIEKATEFFPDLKSRVARVVFILSERRKDEETELFHHIINGWSLIFRVRAETLLDALSFRRLALHELSHASDMLDPAFQYLRALQDNRCNDQQRELARDRFRCLWNICIDARLNRRGEPSLRHREWHEMNFIKQFGVSDLTRRIYSTLWSTEFSSKPTAATLLKAASSPEGLCELVGLTSLDENQLAGIRNFTATCPLCQCPTTEWLQDPSQLSSETIASIHRKFPDWNPALPICRQCEEVFHTSLSNVN
jgi:hypothetical protein